MKTTKQYPIVCPSCGGSGFISNPSIGLTTIITIICPACNGAKTVICTETIEDHVTTRDFDEIDKAEEERIMEHMEEVRQRKQNEAMQKNGYSFETGV